MDSKDDVKDKITLESINEKLNEIKIEIEEIKKQNKDPRGFIVSILLMMSFLLIYFALSFAFQISQPPVEYLLFFLVIYLLCGLGFLWMSIKIMEKKYGKL